MAQTQEVQVILTLEVSIDQNKSDIRKYIERMEMEYTRTCSSKNRLDYSSFSKIEVKEEADIYKTDSEET